MMVLTGGWGLCEHFAGIHDSVLLMKPIFQMDILRHREVIGDLMQSLSSLRLGSRVHLGRVWVSDGRRKEQMTGWREQQDWKRRWESEKAPPRQPQRWWGGLVGQQQLMQRPWGRAQAGAGTNSSDMTRRLDLVPIFQKTNGQMLLRVPDALNLFFFFLIPIKGKALHYYK